MPDDPGWYPDPANRLSERYWDGSSWTEQVWTPQDRAPPVRTPPVQPPPVPAWTKDSEVESERGSVPARARWSGTSRHDEPIPPNPTTGRERTTRKRLWGSVIVIGVCLGGLALYGFHEVCCTHDLLEADFESADGPFQTGVRTDFVAERDQGAYRITSQTASPETPALSVAWLARSAGAVRADVAVVDPGAGTIGVVCALAGSTGTHVNGYGFVVEPGTASLIELGGRVPLQSVPAQPIRPDQRVGVKCGYGRLEGLIDGVVVMSTTYSRGPHSFDRVALYFEPAAKGDTVSFDDVEAHVPG